MKAGKYIAKDQLSTDSHRANSVTKVQFQHKCQISFTLVTSSLSALKFSEKDAVFGVSMREARRCSSWGATASSPASPFSARAAGDLNSSGASMSQLPRGPQPRQHTELYAEKLFIYFFFCMGLMCSEVEGPWASRQIRASAGSDGRAPLGEQSEGWLSQRGTHVPGRQGGKGGVFLPAWRDLRARGQARSSPLASPPSCSQALPRGLLESAWTESALRRLRLPAWACWSHFCVSVWK